MSIFQKKKDGPQLDAATAEQILENVFRFANRPSNAVPLSVLESYSNYRKERYALQRTLILLVLLVFLFLPMFFVVPRAVVTLINPNENANPRYSVQVVTRMPVRSIRAMIRGEEMPLYETDEREYIVAPTSNGELNISVTLINKQNATIQITVTNVDVNSPRLIGTEIESERIYFFVEDEDSGVDFNATEIYDEAGQLKRFSFDEARGMLSVEYPESVTTVRMYDFRHNELSIVLRPTVDAAE